MATTNTNVAAEIYSKRYLAGLTRQLAPLRAFSMDFSAEAKDPGENINVALVSADTAETWDDTTKNFARAGANLVHRSVKIDERYIVGFQITPAQMANFHPQWWEGKADLNSAEMADAILSQIVGLVTADNYGDTAADKMKVSLAGFGRKAITAIRARTIKKKLRVNRSVLVLNPEFFSELLGDLDANVYGGRDAIVGGVIPGLFGFKAVIELPQIESPGFVCHPDAIAVAGRTIPFLGKSPYEKVQEFVEPATGFTMTNVVYIDGPTGKGSFSVNALFGREVGINESLLRFE